MLTLDISKTPYSHFGSRIVLSEDEGALYLRLGSSRKLFRIGLERDGAPLPCTITAVPWAVILTADDARVTFYTHDEHTLAMQAEGAAVTFEMLGSLSYVTANPRPPASWQILNSDSQSFFTFIPVAACAVEVEAPWAFQGFKTQCTGIHATVTPEGCGTCAIFNSTADLPATVPALDVPAGLAARQADWDTFLAKMPAVPDRYRTTAELAWYLLYSCTVAPLCFLKRPGILMSNNHMNNIWSWDHCFNALALADGDPELSWAQLMVIMDQQDDTGRLPDLTNHVWHLWSFVKPPIHGWTARTLLEKYGTDAHCAELYGPLVRWTGWWFAYRDDDGDGLCQYHHGNDSGWDNSTAFDIRPPIEGADLNAYLVLQLDTLGYIAERLGKTDEAAQWHARSTEQLARLLDHHVRDGRFISPQSGTHRVEPTETLLNYLPIVLGARMPADLRDTIVATLSTEGYFLTEYGLATEAVTSPRYLEEGYWRGPIWAPSTYLIVDGLRRAGATDLAREIARRFCDMANGKPGLFENYGALTGGGLCDPGYTWTASVFLLFAHEYLR